MSVKNASAKCHRKVAARPLPSRADVDGHGEHGVELGHGEGEEVAYGAEERTLLFTASHTTLHTKPAQNKRR